MADGSSSVKAHGRAASAGVPTKSPGPTLSPDVPGGGPRRSASEGATVTVKGLFLTPSGAVVPLSEYDPDVHGVGVLQPVATGAAAKDPPTELAPRGAAGGAPAKDTAGAPLPQGGSSEEEGVPPPPKDRVVPLGAAQGSGPVDQLPTTSSGSIASLRQVSAMGDEVSRPATRAPPPLRTAPDSPPAQSVTPPDDIATDLPSMGDDDGAASSMGGSDVEEGPPDILPTLRQTCRPGQEPYLRAVTTALFEQEQQMLEDGVLVRKGQSWGRLARMDAAVKSPSVLDAGAGAGNKITSEGFVRTRLRGDNAVVKRRELRQQSRGGAMGDGDDCASSFHPDSLAEYGEGDGGDDAVPTQMTQRELLTQQARERVIGDELDTLDYTPLPVTAPKHMAHANSPYALRIKRFGRFCRVCICITMYNEDEVEMRETLEGIAENLPGLAAMGIPWENILVVAVMDGRSKANPKLLKYLQDELAAFNESLLRPKLRNDQSVTMHMMESTIEVPNPTSATAGDTYMPMQFAVAMKEENGGKLNSHLWFFDGIAAALVPEYCVLFDIGTRPAADAIVNLIQVFERHPHVGGAAGEIAVRDVRFSHLLEAAQSFEYQIAHDLDKTFESITGYVSVLPGAFSAYRWDAISGVPLEQYFLLERKSADELGPFIANMYLAEDRVLCQEIVLKEGEAWTLYFEASAQAYTDVPQTLQQLIKQRRRWLNGSLFAQISYLFEFAQRIWFTSHPWGRKAVMMAQWFFICTLTVIAWFSIGLLFISYLVIFSAFFSSVASILGLQWDVFVISAMYACCLLLLAIVALVGDVGDLGWLYSGVSLLLAVASVIAISLSVYLLVFRVTFTPLVMVALVASLGPYIIAPCLRGKLLKAGLTGLQYFFFIPTYVNTFQLFAMSNLHDISWGTRAGGAIGTKKKGLEEKSRREARRAERGMQLLQAAAMDTVMATGVSAAAQSEAETAALIDAMREKLGVDELPTEGQVRADIVNPQQAAELLGDVREGDGDGPARIELLEQLHNVVEVHKKQAQEAADAAAKLQLDRKATAMRFNNFRLWVIIALLFSNLLLVAAALTLGQIQQFALVIALFITWSSGIKLVGAFIYSIDRWGRSGVRCCCPWLMVRDNLTGKLRMCCSSPRFYRTNHRWLTRHGFAERDLTLSDITYLKWRRSSKRARAAMQDAPKSMADNGQIGNVGHVMCGCWQLLCPSCSCCVVPVGYKRDLGWSLFQENHLPANKYYELAVRNDWVVRRPNWVRRAAVDTGDSFADPHPHIPAIPTLPLEEETERGRQLIRLGGGQEHIKFWRGDKEALLSEEQVTERVHHTTVQVPPLSPPPTLDKQPSVDDLQGAESKVPPPSQRGQWHMVPASVGTGGGLEEAPGDDSDGVPKGRAGATPACQRSGSLDDTAPSTGQGSGRTTPMETPLQTQPASDDAFPATTKPSPSAGDRSLRRQMESNPGTATQSSSGKERVHPEKHASDPVKEAFLSVTSRGEALSRSDSVSSGDSGAFVFTPSPTAQDDQFWDAAGAWSDSEESGSHSPALTGLQIQVPEHSGSTGTAPLPTTGTASSPVPPTPHRPQVVASAGRGAVRRISVRTASRRVSSGSADVSLPSSPPSTMHRQSSIMDTLASTAGLKSTVAPRRAANKYARRAGTADPVTQSDPGAQPTGAGGGRPLLQQGGLRSYSSVESDSSGRARRSSSSREVVMSMLVNTARQMSLQSDDGAHPFAPTSGAHHAVTPAGGAFRASSHVTFDDSGSLQGHSPPARKGRLSINPLPSVGGRSREGYPPLPSSGALSSVSEAGDEDDGSSLFAPVTPRHAAAQRERNELYGKVAAFISGNSKSHKVRQAYKSAHDTALPSMASTLQRLSSTGMITPSGDGAGEAFSHAPRRSAPTHFGIATQSGGLRSRVRQAATVTRAAPSAGARTWQ